MEVIILDISITVNIHLSEGHIKWSTIFSLTTNNNLLQLGPNQVSNEKY